MVSQALREAGFNVELQPMDWQTLVTRRASQSAPSEGGWNIFITNWMVPEISNPISNPMLNGRGDDAWFGWPTDETIEGLKEEFIDAPDAAAQAAAELTREGKLVSVAGGGDTVAALNKAGVAQDFTFISTAGGAFLEWMEGKELPGVKALDMV